MFSCLKYLSHVTVNCGGVFFQFMPKMPGFFHMISSVKRKSIFLEMDFPGKVDLSRENKEQLKNTELEQTPLFRDWC